MTQPVTLLKRYSPRARSSGVASISTAGGSSALGYASPRYARAPNTTTRTTVAIQPSARSAFRTDHLRIGVIWESAQSRETPPRAQAGPAVPPLAWLFGAAEEPRDAAPIALVALAVALDQPPLLRDGSEEETGDTSRADRGHAPRVRHENNSDRHQDVTDILGISRPPVGPPRGELPGKSHRRAAAQRPDRPVG